MAKVELFATCAGGVPTFAGTYKGKTTSTLGLSPNQVNTLKTVCAKAAYTTTPWVR